jgi:beta-barrel assembly-enhancing protease
MWSRREVDAAKQRNELPKQIDDAVVPEYVSRLTTNIARHSDLQVPPKIFVVRQELRKAGRPALDKEGRPQQVANAMALPGGFLFVYSGLILESETEAELAGVIAHEISHAAARHSHRLANKGKVFGIVQLASAIGLHVFAPGLFQAASYLGYQLKSLLIQGIFQGLGLVFTLEAMGVSRDFELEADQLGMQYAWKSGYDPRGFVDLFDRMSKKDGYASRTSFFATHPAFGDRTLNALREYTALHSLEPDRVYRSDTSEFQEIKQRLRSHLRSNDTEERKQQLEDRESRPTLLRAHELMPEMCESEQFAASRQSMAFPSWP